MKKIVIWLVVSSTVIAISGCQSKKQAYDMTAQIVQSINDNSYFGGYALLQPSKSQDSIFDDGNPETVRLHNSNGDIELLGYYFFYPSDSQIRCLLQLKIYSDTYHLLGITAGSELSMAQTILKEREFTEDATLRQQYGEQYRYFLKGDVIIILELFDSASVIKALHIHVHDPFAPPLEGAY